MDKYILSLEIEAPTMEDAKWLARCEFDHDGDMPSMKDLYDDGWKLQLLTEDQK